MKAFSSLLAGPYSVTETTVAGWDLTDIECTVAGGSTAVRNGATVNLALTSGGSITCVYVNQKPSISIVKRAGTAEDGAEFVTPPGPVTYHYLVTNTGPVTLSGIVVSDDNGTPGTTADDFTATCPKTTLLAGEFDGLHGDRPGHQQSHQHRHRERHVRGRHPGLGHRRRRRADPGHQHRQDRLTTTSWSRTRS